MLPNNDLSQSRRNSLSIFFFTAIIILVIFDRYWFALIAQWREDQGANIYLGYHIFDKVITIGILNTVGMPNPNGHILIGALLSRLPGLISISWALGLIQAAGLMTWAYITHNENKKYFYCALLPLLSSCILRVDGAEFWAQTLFETINILFVSCIVILLYRGSLIALFFVLIFTSFSPTIYLAGAADAINFFIISFYSTFALYRLNKFSHVTKKTIFVFISAIFIVAFFELIITWLPFYKNMGLNQISSLNYQPLIGRISVAVNAIVAFPRCFYELSSIVRPINFIENNYSISNLTKFLLDASSWSTKFQLMIFLVGTIMLIFQKHKNIKIVDVVANYFPLFIIFGVFVLTPLLAGYKYSLHLGIRPDMLYRIYPLYLILLFGGAVFCARYLGMRYFQLCIFSSLFFTFINVTAGTSFVFDVLTNSSPVAEASDAPVDQKVAAVRFIAEDWQKIGNGKPVPVDYDLEGKWPQILSYFDKIYPGAYANGIALDYEFERNYGLINYSNNITDRTKRKAYYVMSFNYSCACEPSHPCSIHKFGRICVKINPNGRTQADQ